MTGGRRWYKVDLHVHSPASRDYEEPHVTYLDWLRKVVEKGIEIVAITDHNTVAGIGAIRRELEWLARLSDQGRLSPEEQQRFDEWRALSNQVVVLPGFEFTATFGFHILGIFPPDTSIRHLEHVLLDLKVPTAKLDEGSTETGATTDVLGAYRIIHDAGGIVIAAHANSTHGVAMRNFPFGGQTKIAYTQDPYLDALEVTDLDRIGHSTMRFFNGTKAEYPRRMHCTQGSDAHRLDVDPRNPKRLGIGERPTELLLDEPTFENIAAVLRSKQFDRVRPAQPADKVFDPLEVVREEGPTLVQSFHETATERGGKLLAILADLCAFANTSGGAVYVGCKPGKTKIKGLTDPAQTEKELRAAVEERFSPRLEVKYDVLQSQTAKVLRIQTLKGPDMPYAIDDNKFYVRDEADTSLAVRDEIVALVREAFGLEREAEPEEGDLATLPTPAVSEHEPLPPLGPQPTMLPEVPVANSGKGQGGRGGRGGRGRQGSGNSAGGNGNQPRAKEALKVQPKEQPKEQPKPSNQQGNQPAKQQGRGQQSQQQGKKANQPQQQPPQQPAVPVHTNGDVDTTFYLPQIGVEIIDVEERNGHTFYAIRDMRNGHVIKNITRHGARKLWSYAIEQYEKQDLSRLPIEWEGNVGLVRAEKRAGKLRYDLALREDDTVRIFYGVTEDGMEGAWSTFLGEE
ncbi:MAG: putative DNA binding domain-containing protein [Caldilineaceae bacterium]